MLAPVAQQEGRCAADNIRNLLTHRPLRRFRYRNRGTMATIGRKSAVAEFGRRAGCLKPSPISPHRWRHTWASDVLRCGMSLPALKELMGHKDIRMTLRYLKVTQPDLQREFYRARHNTPQPYSIPSLSVTTATSDLPGIRQALAATRHLLEMYRRQLSHDKIGRRLQRLDRRLLDVDQQLQNIPTGEK